jgi:YHS domain-containing protein
MNWVNYLAYEGKGNIIATERKALEESSAGGIMTTDPVCGMKVDEKKSEFETQFEGKTYYFCSDSCKQEFDADPEEFAGGAAA